MNSTYMAIGGVPRFGVRRADDLGSERSKERFLLSRHLIRQGYDDGITLISAVFSNRSRKRWLIIP